MKERLSTAICAPSKIGLMFKDKMRIPFLFVLTFFILLCGLGAVRFFNTSYLDMSDVRSITEELYLSENNISYDAQTKKLSGNSIKIDKEYFDIYFMREEKASNSEYILDFTENYVTFYIFGVETKKFIYQDLDIKQGFDLAKARNNDQNEKIALESFLYLIVDDLNLNIGAVEYVTFIGRVISFYIIVFAINFLSTYMLNPTIEKKIRFKLLMYSTLIFFVFMIFYVLLDSEWLMYIALVLPMFYSSRTFAHIRKVR